MHKSAKTKMFILSIFLITSILTPASAASQGGLETLLPQDSLAVLDFKLTDKIKTALDPLLKKIEESKIDDGGRTMLDILRSGKKIMLAGGAMDGPIPWGIFGLPVTESQWKTLMKIAQGEPETYGSSKIYLSDGVFASRLGDYGFGASLADILKKSIDVFDSKSQDNLANDAMYADMNSKLPADRFFGLYFNLLRTAGILKQLVEQNPQEELQALMNLINLYEAMGISASETDNGYKFNIEVKGNSEELTKRGLSFNPGGNFVPSLYKKMPDAKPIFYIEGYNSKAQWESGEKILNDIAKSTGQSITEEVFESIKKEAGIDLPAIYKLFEREYAVAVQYSAKKPFPYITIMGNVNGNKDAGTAIADTLVKALTKELKQTPKNAYKIEQINGITKFLFDITKLDENYNGPPFPKINLVIGVTEDGLFLISNAPGIETSEARAGFEQDVDFSAAYADKTTPVNGITYLNMRNVWGFMDYFVDWAEKVSNGEHTPPLDFYQGYYALLENIYNWRDLLMLGAATADTESASGFITIDSAKHKTYAEFVSEQKQKDSDSDGVPDFDEKYIYKTPTENSDSDSDGYDDIEEINKGLNPNGEGVLFKDVSQKDWYVKEVGQTWNAGVVKGYEDQTFKPNKLVSRAEFTAMVVRAFEEDTSRFLGVNIEFQSGYNLFTDVPDDAWFEKPISKAASLGWVRGKTDSQTGQLFFRPNDPITRAEAVQIIGSASKALQKVNPSRAALPFKDVNENQWFYGAVANAYASGLSEGKKKDEFQPMANLTRAEAATFLARAIKLNTEQQAEKPGFDINLKSLYPMFAPMQIEDGKIMVEEPPFDGVEIRNDVSGRHNLGDPSAPVEMIIFSSLGCPYCAQFSENVMPLIKQNYVDTGKVKIAFRHMPMEGHPQAKTSSLAAECAGDQGKFWEMHDILLLNQTDWAGNASASSKFEIYAEDIGLDQTKFNECMASGKFKDIIDADIAYFKKINVQGAPSFFINGQELLGSRPYDEFVEIFESQMND